MTSVPSCSELQSLNLSDFITSCPPPQSYFQRVPVNDAKIREKLNLLRLRLNQVFAKLKEEKCDTVFLPLHQRRYKEINYKHSLSQRHQKFWKATQQLMKQQKKINESNFLGGFKKIVEGLTKSASSYEYTKEGIIFAGSQFIQQIAQLDKLRILCIRAINHYMGYIELGHFLVFLLILVAMAAELSAEANRQIKVLRELYNTFGEYLHSVDKRFPLTSKDIPFESEQVNSKVMSNEVELIMKLVTTSTWEERKIIEKYREVMGLGEISETVDFGKGIDAETSQQALTMTQQLLSLSSSSSSRKTNKSTTIFGRK